MTKIIPVNPFGKIPVRTLEDALGPLTDSIVICQEQSTFPPSYTDFSGVHIWQDDIGFHMRNVPFNRYQQGRWVTGRLNSVSLGFNVPKVREYREVFNSLLTCSIGKTLPLYFAVMYALSQDSGRVSQEMVDIFKSHFNNLRTKTEINDVKNGLTEFRHDCHDDPVLGYSVRGNLLECLIPFSFGFGDTKVISDVAKYFGFSHPIQIVSAKDNKASVWLNGNESGFLTSVKDYDGVHTVFPLFVDSKGFEGSP